jgi:glycosyltransferase involved in cell wall biosynthesis
MEANLSEETPRVSIGFPVYNGVQFLEQAIKCILGQTYRDFELVICDNASTDETGRICEGYAAKDNRVRYIRNPENIGAAPNFNRTFTLSRGEYFTWVAHDDLYGATWLERCVDALDSNPDVVLAHTSVRLIDGEGRVLTFDTNLNGIPMGHGKKAMPLDENHLAESIRVQDRFGEVLREISWCSAVFGLFRSDVLRKTKLQRSYYGADKVFLAEMSLLGSFHQVDEVLFDKRVHDGMSFFQSVKEKREWIDPKGETGVPQLLMLRDYVLSVLSSPLGLDEKVACLCKITTLFRRGGLWRRIFVPGPDNYLGIDFHNVRSKNAD